MMRLAPLIIILAISFLSTIIGILGVTINSFEFSIIGHFKLSLSAMSSRNL